MTARTIVEAERHENLVAFEEIFAGLEGVGDEHVTALRRASTTRPGVPLSPKRRPSGTDRLHRRRVARAC